jgi:hypothetical protein
MSQSDVIVVAYRSEPLDQTRTRHNQGSLIIMEALRTTATGRKLISGFRSKSELFLYQIFSVHELNSPSQ